MVCGSGTILKVANAINFVVAVVFNSVCPLQLYIYHKLKLLNTIKWLELIMVYSCGSYRCVYEYGWSRPSVRPPLLIWARDLFLMFWLCSMLRQKSNK